MALLSHYNRQFEQLLRQLTPTQLEAVQHIEGTVITIAGPGTGKTHILAARIGYILSQTDTQPHNILCLTYTDAGVIAMRERLLQFIGPEAHKVHIYTFHSFCNAIIRDNMEQFGKRGLEPLSELERVDIIRQLIDELPYGHAFKYLPHDPYFYEGHLAHLFRQMKLEDWQPAHVQQRAHTYAQLLPTLPAFQYQRTIKGKFQKGDPKEKDIQAMTERMALLQAGAALFPRYEALLQTHRRYDFEDMLLWVLRAFEKNELLLRSYQERYLYFLVDEYQDTNGAQNELLLQLISYWQQPNIFIVGDDDQSIYEFQGARLKNLLDFYQRYREEAKVIVLTDNFRSSQILLDNAKYVIDHNQLRITTHLTELGIQKNLTAKNDVVAHLALSPQVRVVPNPQQEVAAIRAFILEKQAQGVPLHEIAIIYARHAQADLLIGLLEREQIPYFVKRPLNILQLPVIRQVLTLLQYLATETAQPFSGEPLLYQLLYFDFWKIAPLTIAQASVAIRHPDHDTPYWRTYIAHHPSFKAVSEAIESLFTLLHEVSLPTLLEQTLLRTGLLQHLFDQPDKVQLVKVVYSFLEFVKQEGTRHPMLSIAQLLDTLQSMRDNDLLIPVQQVQLSTQGVQLLSAHGSKGLEYTHVWVMGVLKDAWEKQRSSYHQFVFPDTLTFSGEEDGLEAKRRLFYVALTRAKASVTISYAAQDHKGKPTERSRFITELFGEHPENLTSLALPEATLHHQQATLLQSVPTSSATLLDTELIAAVLKDFRLSIGALNAYLHCPLGFYYQYILRVPRLTGTPAAYGIAVHQALRRFFEHWIYHKHAPPPTRTDLLHFFEEELALQHVYIPARLRAHYEAAGKHILHLYHVAYHTTWQAFMRTEYAIYTQWQGIPLTGVIDQVQYHAAGTAQLVDFKTKVQDLALLSAPSEKQPFGGDYWRQLAFYKVLFESYQKKQPLVTTGTIIWLADHKGALRADDIALDGAAEIAIKALLRTTYDNIMGHQFAAGCGAKDCVWCNGFGNSRQLQTLSDSRIEELDD